LTNEEKESKKEEKKKLKIEIGAISENKILDRKEISFTVSHPGLPTPSKKEVADLLAKSLGLSEDDAVAISITPRFGSNRPRGRAKVYPNMESMIRIEGGGNE